MCAQSYLTLCNPRYCSPPGSSVHGIFQTRVLDWSAVSSSRGIPKPGIKLATPALAGRLLTTVLPRKPYHSLIPLLSIYPKKMKTLIQKDICTPTFITALFITAKICKQPKHPYTHTQTQTHTRMYTFKYIMEYYSAIHRLCNCSAGCSCYLSGTGGDMYWGEGENPGVSKSHNFKCFLIVSIWSIMKLIKILVKYRLLGRKVMTNLDSILKSRDISLPTEVCLVKAMVFPVVMYGCESWTIKKAEHWRIDAFELWC